MLVTWPFVLLLLDWWPLGRLQLSTSRNPSSAVARPASFWRLVAEKAPFFALSAASCVVTVIAQEKGAALSSFAGAAGVSVESRISNALVSYVWYLAKLLWPSHLTVIYPFVRVWPMERVLLAAALLLVLTGVALWQGRRRPYLPVGWLWYLGTLIPVIGLVKVGAQSIADRYTYIPAIGLFIVLAWGVADLTAGWRKRTPVLAAAAAAVLVAYAVTAGAQILCWQDTESLFRHALAVTRDNYIAYNNLGLYVAEHGELELGKKYYRLAIEIAPNYAPPRNSLGTALVQQKKYEEAITAFESALSINPRSAEIEGNLGATLYCLGRTDEAINHLQEAIRLNPEHSMAHFSLANALLQKDRLDEAMEHYRAALQLNPRYGEAQCNLALALVKQGKREEATAQFQRALAMDPGLWPAHFGLGELLIDQGRFEGAVEQFSEVLRLQHKHEPAWLQLGIARAGQGKLPEAVAAFSVALRIQPDDAEAHYHLAMALGSQHETKEAIRHYHEALKALPDFPEALNNLAWLLAANPDPQVRNGHEAVDLAERACKLTEYKQPIMIGTLAAAYAEAGRFAEAVTTAEKAETLAKQSNQMEVAAKNRSLRELYRSGQPFRDTP